MSVVKNILSSENARDISRENFLREYWQKYASSNYLEKAAEDGFNGGWSAAMRYLQEREEFDAWFTTQKFFPDVAGEVTITVAWAAWLAARKGVVRAD